MRCSPRGRRRQRQRSPRRREAPQPRRGGLVHQKGMQCRSSWVVLWTARQAAGFDFSAVFHVQPLSFSGHNQQMTQQLQVGERLFLAMNLL